MRHTHTHIDLQAPRHDAGAMFLTGRGSGVAMAITCCAPRGLVRGGQQCTVGKTDRRSVFLSLLKKIYIF